MAAHGIVHTASRTSFSYTPPQSVYGAVRVLVIADRVQEEVLANVLRGFWRFTPLTRVLIAEHEALAPTMLNDNMRPVDLSELPMRPYANRVGDAGKKVIAPTLMAEVDACVVINTFDGESGTLPSLEALCSVSTTPAATDPVDAFFALRHLIAGSVVDAGEKIVWGDDLLDVDRTVYTAVNQTPPPQIADLKRQLKTLAIS